MTASLLAVEVAQVYRVGRRRYFSKSSAIRALARQWVKARCDCEFDRADYEAGYPGYHSPCKYHCDPERYAALLARLVSLAPKYVGSSGKRPAGGKK